ncbi:F-actin-capping protein subunit beta [Entomophthora muscae]|uniref:F-actin-capping protein subunit beta n=1 Tax=Entomophthora muscae TaxID=34485 RepID=A0ACC2UJT5_9FUNG|nr:F-actin-capping protein subunit beta [Entomophthora muscae]
MKYNPVECVVDLMRRLPPQNIETNLETLCDVLPECTEAFYEAIDKPLEIAKCLKTGKDYLLCDFNRDGDSFRSPWSNEFYPEIESDLIPSAALRTLEVAFNDAFEVYRKLYYEGGISSVYIWEQRKGFSGAILIKKVNDANKQVRGAWDSIHMFEANINSNAVHYKLSSTVMLYTITSNDSVGTLNLSGNIRRVFELETQVQQANDHIVHLGQLVEEQEGKIRNTLQEVYFQKTKDIVNDIRSLPSLQEAQQRDAFRSSLNSRIQGMKISDSAKGEEYSA